MFQQGLLLLFVEGLNFVQIQQHPVGSHEGIQLRHDLLDVCRGSGGGVELVEGAVGLLGNDIGDGGLSRAAGAVEHHVGDVPGIDQAAQHRALAQNMLLTVDLVQRLRPQKIGEWLIHMDALSCVSCFLSYTIPYSRRNCINFFAKFCSKKFPLRRGDFDSERRNVRVGGLGVFCDLQRRQDRANLPFVQGVLLRRDLCCDHDP